MAKKKITLSGNYGNEFAIIGIACHNYEYRIAHFLNKDSEFNFIRYDDLEVSQKNNEKPLVFPFYYFDDTENCVTYHFIANRTTDGFWVNEWKQMDYLLIAFGSGNQIDLTSKINQIKEIPIVLAVTKMPFTKKLGIENLMTDLELHIIEILKKQKLEEKELKNKLRNNRFKQFIK